VKLTALTHAIVLSYGWRRWLIAFAAGAASALAMAARRKLRSRAGGSALVIFSPVFIGSVTPSWSTRRRSVGCCPSP
jgi:hypothetical protein